MLSPLCSTSALLILVLFCLGQFSTPSKADEVPVPAGVQTSPDFSVNVLTAEIKNPRTITVTESGLVLVTSSSQPQVYGLRIDASGHATHPFVVVDNVRNLHGIVSKGHEVWLGESGRVLHFTLDSNDKAGLVNVVIDHLPSGGGHHWRMVAIGPDNRLYTHIGCSSNIGEDLDNELSRKRQKIWSYNLDGSDEKLFCVGLRNTEKVEWDPVTGKMWGIDHGSDNISKDPVINDDNPSCEFNLLEQDVDYGHPYIVTGQDGKNMIRPEYANRPDIQEKLKNCRPSAFVLGGHVAPTGFTFYRGKKFPPIYENAAFICLHGSWNRTVKNGYRVDALIFKDGRPTEAKTVLNFLLDDRSRAVGRPVDAVTAPDGSLYVTDDAGSKIYRLTAK